MDPDKSFDSVSTISLAMKFSNTILFPAALLLLCLQVCGQEWELGFGAGIFNYQGELRSERFTSKGMRPAWSAGIRKQLGDKTGLSAMFSSSMLTGRDADNPSYLTRRRNLHFKTRILELSLNAIRYLTIHPDGYFKPFISAGSAMFYVNPFTYDRQGAKHYIYNLSLEGQGLKEYPQVRSPHYINVAVPIGAGVALRLSRTLCVEMEMQARKTFTDQIDGVSGFYPREESLRQARGLSAVDLAYRADELAGEDPCFPQEGTMRGNPKTMDWYYGLMLRFVWNDPFFFQSYPPRRKLFKPRGWPYRL